MIIGVAGKIGSGKDTIAEILIRKFGFARMAMADALREETAEALDTGIAPLGCPDDIRAIIEDPAWFPEAVHLKPTPRDMRHLLQWWGSHRRDRNPHYWVKLMRVRLSNFSGHVVIPDIRYANEAALVREFGGYVWIVRRMQADAVRDPATHSHISERFCEVYQGFDCEIENHGTLEELDAKVTDLAKCYRELDRIHSFLTAGEGSQSEIEGCQGGQIDWQRELREIQLEDKR